MAFGCLFFALSIFNILFASSSSFVTHRFRRNLLVCLQVFNISFLLLSPLLFLFLSIASDSFRHSLHSFCPFFSSPLASIIFHFILYSFPSSLFFQMCADRVVEFLYLSYLKSVLCDECLFLNSDDVSPIYVLVSCSVIMVAS